MKKSNFFITLFMTIAVLAACMSPADASPDTEILSSATSNPAAAAPALPELLPVEAVNAGSPTQLAPVLVEEEPQTPSTGLADSLPAQNPDTLTHSADLSASMPALPSPETACLICDIDLSSYTGPLTEQEVHGLLLALNDEYHAWAVYGQVVADFGNVRPFTSIQGSEASHINFLEGLFDVYGLPVPDNPWIGGVGSYATMAEACQVGVTAEILNATLYDQLFESTAREDILTVYTLLQSASLENHLPAFERWAGGTGTAQGPSGGSQFGRTGELGGGQGGRQGGRNGQYGGGE